MQTLPPRERILEANTRYHDLAAAGYDAKWGIDFGEVGRAQVLAKVQKLLGSTGPCFDEALEIGAGTGYFGLHLRRAGVVASLTCSDVSSGMLETLRENAARLGLDNVETVSCEAESLPFQGERFDLVLGHAVLHHIPDLAQAFGEFHRVLRPGGVLLFAGEPSRLGDRIARLPKRAALVAAPLWRRALRVRPLAPPAPESAEELAHTLEAEVDIHAFSPRDLRRLAADAGFERVSVLGEELTANWFGWLNRGLEASGHPEDVPRWWRSYAFYGYLALQRLDRVAFEPRLPAAAFYNLLITARKPEESAA